MMETFPLTLEPVFTEAEKLLRSLEAKCCYGKGFTAYEKALHTALTDVLHCVVQYEYEQVP